MNEYTKKKFELLAGAIAFCFCIGLIMKGQRTISYPALAQMLIGLCGILGLLWLYNRSCR